MGAFHYTVTTTDIYIDERQSIINIKGKSSDASETLVGRNWPSTAQTAVSNHLKSIGQHQLILTIYSFWMCRDGYQNVSA